MGIILDRNSTSTPFGYDWSGTQGGHFAAPSEVISLLMVGLFPDGQDHGETDLFRQAYSDHGGYQMFGAPWDNGRGLLVHCWPDECDHPDVLLVQDFLRSDGYWSQLVYSTYINEVVPVHGAILEYWNSHWGYSSYGAPLVSEYAKTINGEVWHVQDFQRDQDALVRTIGYNPETLEVGEVIPDGRGGFWIALGDDDDDDLPLPSIPCLDPISASQQGLENFYSGMILNGQADICAAYGWQAFYANGEAFLSHCCSQGELTINNGNCVIAAVTRQAGNRYHAQLTNSQWPALSLEAGQTYCFSAWVRNDSPLAQRTITVVLTPRSSYDHFNPIASLTEVLAPPAQFLITDSWQEISHYFSVSQSEDNAALRFFFGDQLGAIRLDDIYLEVVDFNNHDPTLDFQPDQGDDQVAVTYGYNSQKQILGLIGEALPYQEAETITLLINDYPNNGVHSTQAFDPTGNTFDLPDQTYGLCTFLITDYSGLDHWFNVWAWYLNQATVSGIKFRWAEVPLPVASCQNQGGDITAELSYEYAAGNLRGLIFDTLYWQDITTVSVWVDGYGIYDTQPFNSLGNVLDLPDQTYQQANFFLTDTSGQDHWLDLWAWQWSGASLNFSWLNWSQLLN